MTTMNKHHLSQQSLDIIELRKKYPCYTLKHIADIKGISRERVRQILKRDNLPTRHLKRGLQYYTCLNCGKETTHKSGLCCLDCRNLYYTINLVCDNCGITFPRLQTLIIKGNKPRSNSTYPAYKGNQFCSRKCFGQWLGNNHGFKMHPENAGRVHRLGVSKYEYLIPEISKLAQQGLSLNRIGVLLNLPTPRSTVYSKSFKRLLANHNIVNLGGK